MPACPRTTQTQVEDGRALVSLAVRDNEHLLVGALILQGVRSDKITGFKTYVIGNVLYVVRLKFQILKTT